MPFQIIWLSGKDWFDRKYWWRSHEIKNEFDSLENVYSCPMNKQYNPKEKNTHKYTEWTEKDCLKADLKSVCSTTIGS